MCLYAGVLHRLFSPNDRAIKNSISCILYISCMLLMHLTWFRMWFVVLSNFCNCSNKQSAYYCWPSWILTYHLHRCPFFLSSLRISLSSVLPFPLAPLIFNFFFNCFCIFFYPVYHNLHVVLSSFKVALLLCVLVFSFITWKNREWRHWEEDLEDHGFWPG